MSHALVVGGTGMLKEVSLALAARFTAVSVVARPSARLRALENEAPSIHAIGVEWSKTKELRGLLAHSAVDHGPFTLAVVWAHDDVPDVPMVAADFLEAGGAYYHVLGSDAADPTAPERSFRARIEADHPSLRYHEVILGFVLEAGHSRWLQNAEISAGVLAAIDADQQTYVVGAVTPWSARP